MITFIKLFESSLKTEDLNTLQLCEAKEDSTLRKLCDKIISSNNKLTKFKELNILELVNGLNANENFNDKFSLFIKERNFKKLKSNNLYTKINFKNLDEAGLNELKEQCKNIIIYINNNINNFIKHNLIAKKEIKNIIKNIINYKNYSKTNKNADKNTDKNLNKTINKENSDDINKIENIIETEIESNLDILIKESIKTKIKSCENNTLNEKFDLLKIDNILTRIKNKSEDNKYDAVIELYKALREMSLSIYTLHYRLSNVCNRINSQLVEFIPKINTITGEKKFLAAASKNLKQLQILDDKNIFGRLNKYLSNIKNFCDLNNFDKLL